MEYILLIPLHSLHFRKKNNERTAGRNTKESNLNRTTLMTLLKQGFVPFIAFSCTHSCGELIPVSSQAPSQPLAPPPFLSPVLLGKSKNKKTLGSR